MIDLKGIENRQVHLEDGRFIGITAGVDRFAQFAHDRIRHREPFQMPGLERLELIGAEGRIGLPLPVFVGEFAREEAVAARAVKNTSGL